MAARIIFAMLMLLLTGNVMAQRFYNLTADEVKIDSILPVVSHQMLLPDNYRDSVYTAELLYPEFIDMTPADVLMYNGVCGAPLPEMPVVRRDMVVAQKRASMLFSFSPLVFRDGRYQILVSYMLNITSDTANEIKSIHNTRHTSRASASDRYSNHSILASGRWAKISVSNTGFHQLTETVIKKAGFKDMSKVRIYGYGGNLVPEVLTPDYLAATDDLKEVPSAMVNGRRVFYGKGPVYWESPETDIRVRNPYSDTGCYFITEAEGEPLIVSDSLLLADNYPSAADYHSLHEVDKYAWYNAGRNLVDNVQVAEGGKALYTIATPDGGSSGFLTVCVSSNAESTYSVSCNDSVIIPSRNIQLTDKKYDKAAFTTRTVLADNLKATNTITLSCNSGGPLRLDYISLRTTEPAAAPDLTTDDLPQAEYVYNITNQDHHADANADMIIIIPTSQRLLEQAERIKQLHETKDTLSVIIVPADELYNEFSSGTPDISAYRRYIKMMYDRAESGGKHPRYVLLFGACLFDNRLLTASAGRFSQDDLLLCYESENSANKVYSFVSDDFIAMLDDNEQIGYGDQYLGIPDVAVGRIPAVTPESAKAVVDKIVGYAENRNVGPWQNTLLFMGDDGDNNLHMRDLDNVAEDVITNNPGYNVRKVIWDAYKRTESSTGNRYPDVEQEITSQQNAGALIMDYAGHGSETAISHEYVLKLTDFNAFTNNNLPLWVTASCDIGPFDSGEDNIGESIVTNPKGGGIAFYGTSRTVYANYNKYINQAFIKALLSVHNGRRTTLGDANRLAKEYLVTSGLDRSVNKLQYSLLGDPALALNMPLRNCVIDSINGVAVREDSCVTLRANSKVRITGRVLYGKDTDTLFTGLISTLVKDNRVLKTCLDNEGSGTPFEFYDRTNTLFSGTDSVRNGCFALTFVVPKDINYSDERGLITLFAYNADGSKTANGETTAFLIGGSDEVFNDSIGPSLYCYLNSKSFVNGGTVNTTPFFVAEITDKDGINASGSGIGHDMKLIIDNDVSKVFKLNSNFQFDFGTYTSGTTFHQLPSLSEGMHTLTFRAWDMLNNQSATQLTFNVSKSVDPQLFSINVTNNPARTDTRFIILHDRPGSVLDVDVEIFDMSGRLLHIVSQTVMPSSTTVTIPWNLTVSNGNRLQTGVYLYRVRITAEDGSKVSKAKKLIITGS